MSEYVIDITGVRRAELSDDEFGFIAMMFGLPVHEKVIRCRDCKHYRDHEWIIVTDVSDVCHFWDEGGVKVEPDGFCKWGERREVSK